LEINKIIQDHCLPQLHPDLQPYLQGDELHHPLLKVEGGVYPRLYQRINKVYRDKTMRSLQPQNQWQAYLPDRPHPERISRFIQAEALGPDFPRQAPEYFELLGQIWTDPDLLMQSSSFLELMLGMGSAISWDKLRQPLSPHVFHLMTPAEQQKLAELPHELRVFRGHGEPLLHGLSWTLNLDVALLWAIGNPLPSCLSIGTLQKSEVIAVIDRWNEAEIIVPTQSVHSIQTYKITG
jgi:hypothetical protein